jgi:serine/threonine protein kinase
MVDYEESKGLEYYDRDEVEDDDEGIQRFAIKRIFPTINAPYILIEMLILKLIKGHEYITNLVAGYRKESQVSLVFEYQRSQSFLVSVFWIIVLGVRRKYHSARHQIISISITKCGKAFGR